MIVCEWYKEYSIVNLKYLQSHNIMGGEKRWPLVEGPPISVGRLVLMLTTVGEQLMFLMKHDIISDNGLCHKCDQVITGEWVVKGNGRYWRCKDCAVMTSCRYGTVLYQSKMKIKNWVLLAYCFTERHRTHASTVNEASLPQEGYVDRTLSTRTILRWFRYFRMLCRDDFKKNKSKIGGEGSILEGDESLFGQRSCKIVHNIDHSFSLLFFRKALGSLTILTTMFKIMKICLVKQS